MRLLSTLLIMCLILESCSYQLSNSWRSPSSEAKFEDLKSKFSNFKGKVAGSERDKNCSKEDLDKDFNRLMNSLKQDSCSESNFKLDREEFNQRSCPKIKTEGVIDRVVKKIIAEEKAKKVATNFENGLDQEFIGLYKEALSYKQLLKNAVMNDSLDLDVRIDLVANYVENILLPFRDLVIIKRSYQSKEKDGTEYINQLLPEIPDSMTRGLSTEQQGLLTLGPNPSAAPFYLEIKETKNPDIYQLSFSASDIIRRDVTTLLKAPTAKNYVLALKWMTLHMMLSQLYIYNTILDKKDALEIPNSCQNHFNGNLPSTFSFKFEEGAGEKFVENILASHGLTYKQDDTGYLDYYIDNVQKDPTKDGYSGLMPFENYKNARVGLTSSRNGPLDAELDDIAHYENIINSKASEVKSVFKDVAEKRSRATVSKYNITYTGFDTFQDILTGFQGNDTAEIKLKDGSTKQIYTAKQNLSAYLLKLMQRNGLENYSQLISPRLKKKFVGKKINIDFPSLYSSPIWRNWSLKLLADVFNQYKDVSRTTQLGFIVSEACRQSFSTNTMSSTGNKSVCATPNPIATIASALSEFRSGDTYIPTRRLEESKFKEIYPLLGFIWRDLRDTTELLPEARPFELNFLLEQMDSGNPWARLKLSYMIALDQLEYQKDGVPPVYEFNGLWFNVDEKAKCDSKLIETQYDKIKEAGKKLGLDHSLSNNFANKMLSVNEKKAIWRNIYDDIQQRNAQLFSVKAGNNDYYQLTEGVSYKTILNTDQALNAGVKLSESARNEITENAKSNQAQISNFFLSLYKMKGQPEKQKELFEKFSKINGIDESYKLKLSFLAVDESYKKPLYKELLRQAAQARKQQIIGQLNTFCSMDVNNQKEFKNIFYSTSKAQNEINQLAGLPTIPEEIMSKVNEMSPEEFRDMWWGIGSGIAGMAAIIVGGACTAVSGGICAPLGGAMAVAGMASLGIQVKLTSNEYGRKLEADENEQKVKYMEDLGFANTGSADEVHRSIAWTAFEAISIFPLMGIATKSMVMGPKLVYVSTQSMLRQTGKTAFKAAAKTVAEEEEVRMARYLIGLESVSKNLGVDAASIGKASNQIQKIRNLYQMGEIDFDTMIKRIAKILDPIKRAKLAAAKSIKSELGSVVVKESKEVIDHQVAKVVSEYFSESSESMLKVISSYSGERLNRAVKIMAEMQNPKRIGRGIPIYRNVKDWFLKMRNESLAKNASKILRIEKELQALPNKPGALEEYVYKNMEDLTDIFIDIPMRKREIPYVVQIQGMPSFNFINGRKIPLLSMMSEGQTLKKVFQSRARLVFETYKTQARTTLKLSKHVKAHTTMLAFKAFEYSVADMASRKSAEEAAKITAEYEALELKLSHSLYAEYLKGGNKMEYTAFHKLVTNPSNRKEEAMAEVIWESVQADELLKMKEVSEIAHKAVAELSNYNDVDEFTRYLSALKILILNRTPTVLDI
jgi:hypothetical protein